jgi:hypothetical protein
MVLPNQSAIALLLPNLLLLPPAVMATGMLYFMSMAPPSSSEIPW